MSDAIRIAIVVNPELPPGFLANTVGAIAIGLGARRPDLADAELTDREGQAIDISSNRPVPILQASLDSIKALALKAIPKRPDLTVVAFPAFARALNDYADYERTFPERDLAEEPIDGIGLAGPEKLVRSLTGSLKLLR